MRNIRLKIAYKGTAYHGWQVQANAVSVQGVLEAAIEKIFSYSFSPTLYGCSRTDAGVHANEFVCNFRCPGEKFFPCGDIARAINANIPDDIVVLDCDEAPADFHSRYDCKSKEYIYNIWNSEKRNPFLTDTAYHYKYKLDDVLLDTEAKSFVGTHDFSAFCSSGSSVKSAVRTVTRANVARDGELVRFAVEADGFLYNMVRIMVGTLIGVNEGKIGRGKIGDIIAAKERSGAGATAPPTGLFLNRVFYS